MSAVSRVLVVEDHPDVRRMTEKLLAISGYEISTADDGEAGLAALSEGEFDAALIDIGLPKMNGYELAKAVRADSRLDDLLLVALTGYGQPEDRRQVLEAGFDAHFIKPLELDRLVEFFSAAERR